MFAPIAYFYGAAMAQKRCAMPTIALIKFACWRTGLGPARKRRKE